MILETVGFFVLFILLTLLIFYPVGYLILGKNTGKLAGQEVITLSFAVSIVLFVLLALTLSFVHMRAVAVVLLIGINLYSIIRYKFELLKPWRSLSSNVVLLILVFLGILVQGFISFPSGYLYKEGLLFWSSQAFDGFWHVSLMEAVAKGIPPQNLLFSGTYLQNYHYLVDILMGEYYRIFNFFSPLDLYYRFFPVLFSFLMGLSVFSFMGRWKGKAVGNWSVFFTYFVGSFGYVVTYLQSGRLLGGETAFWVSQLNTVVANPPHASAIILLCSFLLSFLIYTKEKSKSWFLISMVIGLIISGFKVSGGAVLLGGLGVASLFRILREKKFDYLILFSLLLASNFLTITFVAKDAESYLIFQPWWFIRTMVVVKLGLLDWELRRQTYLSVGRFTSYLRILQLEGTALLIFIVGNLGARIIGFPLIIKKLLHFKVEIFKSPIDTFLISSALVGFLVPMLFLQKGIVYNSIQFMQYVLLITGFYAAIFTYHFLKKIKPVVPKHLVALVLIALSIPTVIGNFVEFYGGPPNAKISNDELSALSYLKDNSNPGDIILTPPFDVNAKYGYRRNPLPIYAWTGTAYIASLAGRPTYLSCEDMLRQTGYDVDSRLSEENNFFSQKDFSFNRNFLSEKDIAYVYVSTPGKYQIQEEENSLTKVFSNNEVNIYKVEK
jgi:hypothetical protein